MMYNLICCIQGHKIHSSANTFMHNAKSFFNKVALKRPCSPGITVFTDY